MIWRGNRRPLKRLFILSHDLRCRFLRASPSSGVRARVRGRPAELLGDSPSSKSMVLYEIEAQVPSANQHTIQHAIQCSSPPSDLPLGSCNATTKTQTAEDSTENDAAHVRVFLHTFGPFVFVSTTDPVRCRSVRFFFTFTTSSSTPP